MASRPIFVITEKGIPIIKQIEISFNWNPGFAPSQQKKNIFNLHKEAEKQGVENVLEVSTKSENELGKKLSNLIVNI